MSASSAKKHPWARYKGRPLKPSPLRARDRGNAGAPLGRVVAAPRPTRAPAPTPPPARVRTPAPMVQLVKSRAPAPAPKAKPAPVVHVPAPVEAPSADLAAELGETVTQIEALQAAPFVPSRRVRAEGQGQLSWVWDGVKDSVRNYRATGRWLAEWWRGWRGSASSQVLMAFVAMYVLLALVRAPSDEVAERARHAEEIAFFGGFLKNYSAAGGTVLAEKPHGGSELYPRGVLLKGELLSTFERTPVGEVFVARVTSADSNLLAGFYGYPPIFVGGSYFNLERPFNYSLYRCTYLIRKDSEKSGALLMARLEVAQ